MARLERSLLSSADLIREAHEVLLDSDIWLDTPNQRLGNRKPREFLEGSEDERQILHDILQAAKFGLYA